MRRRSNDCARRAMSTLAPAQGASSRPRPSAQVASAFTRAPAATVFPPIAKSAPRARGASASRGAHVDWRDRLQGPQAQDLARDVGDFVVRRADGLFAYQLAVVVDDAAQGITDIVRGADLIASTARQMLLQQRLGVATPSYLHVPIAIGGTGEKLSKQTHAAPLPATPLPALIAAWRFLEQPLPAGSATPATLAEFWQWAAAAWNPARLPPVAMLPAPAAFRPGASGGV